MHSPNGHSSRDIWLKHTQARHALALVLPALARAGVQPVLVKGVALEATLYGDSAQRAISDVDLRVLPTQFKKVREVAMRAGWTIASFYPAYGSLCLDIENMPVDIESHIGPPGLGRLRVKDLLDHGSMQTIGSTAVMVPDVTDHALLVIVNLFKDKITTAMPWAIGDLSRLVAHQDFDEQLFLARAKRYRMALMSKVVLHQLGHDTPALRSLSNRVKAPAWFSLYLRAYNKHAKAPHALTARLLARAGSDAPLDWARALFLAARLEYGM